MNIYRFFSLIIMVIAVTLLVACTTQGENDRSDADATPLPLATVSLEDIEVVTGQLIYVPAYSEIFFDTEESTLDLAITLAFRNTDLNNPIIITSARYYDTDGKLVRDYVDTPIKLPPMATTGVVIAQGDKRGGVGASFLVEWVAESDVNEPVVEAIMISIRGSQGVSFVSRGRAVQQTQ